MSQRLVEFDADSLLKLLVHYSQGEIPITSEIKNIQVSARLPRWIALIVDSPEWDAKPYEAGDGYNTVQPMFFRYEGKRVCVIDHLKDPIAWGDENAVETPQRQ